MGTLNKHGYQKLIDENIEALEKYMPEHSLEKKHTIEVLKWSIKQIYESDGVPADLENANCAICDVSAMLPTYEDIEKQYRTRDPENPGFAYGAPCNKDKQEGARWVIEFIKAKCKANPENANCAICDASGSLLTDVQSYEIAQKYYEYCYMQQDDSLAIGAKAIPLIFDECLKILTSNDR